MCRSGNRHNSQVLLPRRILYSKRVLIEVNSTGALAGGYLRKRSRRRDVFTGTKQ